MLTKHTWTNTQSLKPCFTAYPVQHKNKSEKYVQNTLTDKLLALTVGFSEAANCQAFNIFHITSGHGIEKLCLR